MDNNFVKEASHLFYSSVNKIIDNVIEIDIKYQYKFIDINFVNNYEDIKNIVKQLGFESNVDLIVDMEYVDSLVFGKFYCSYESVIKQNIQNIKSSNWNQNVLLENTFNEPNNTQLPIRMFVIMLSDLMDCLEIINATYEHNYFKENKNLIYYFGTYVTNLRTLFEVCGGNYTIKDFTKVDYDCGLFVHKKISRLKHILSNEKNIILMNKHYLFDEIILDKLINQINNLYEISLFQKDVYVQMEKELYLLKQEMEMMLAKHESLETLTTNDIKHIKLLDKTISNHYINKDVLPTQKEFLIGSEA